MTQPINITVPATISAISGLPALSSLMGLPASLSVSDSNSGAYLTIELVAANSAASLTVSNAGGAAISSNANTLQVSGYVSQVNAALASLEISEPSGVTSDIISILAEDGNGASALSNFALNLTPQISPAFVAPPKLVTLAPNQPLGLPGLLLSNPDASALAAMGLGAEETLQLTLSVESGVLLLPGYNTLTGIEAEGVGTGTIHLTLSANDVGALNTLLTSLEFAGPSLTSGQHLTYALWDHDGVLARKVTSGNIYLSTVGKVAASGTYDLGGQTLITGTDSLAGGLSVTGLLSVMGDVTSSAGVTIGPDAILELPGGTAELGGTSYDFGLLESQELVVSGQFLAGESVSLGGELVLGTNALMVFSGAMSTGGDAGNDYQEGLSLGSGAVLEGSGVLAVGNFSESGMIDGTGTILALQGGTLEIDAGMVSAGVNLDVAGGGVMVLGPDDSLYGIFDTTPLTVQSGVTLTFLGPGSAPITGGYANTLGGTGGAFVLNGPADFSGTITGFAVGDELIFPGLTGLTIVDTASSAGNSFFQVAGVDENGTTQVYTIYASIPTGYSLVPGKDAEGDSEVGLRLTPAPYAMVNSYGALTATAGVTQPVLGLSLVLGTATTQSLTITLSAAHGKLTTGAQQAASSITLSANDVGALNEDLTELNYIGTGMLDVITLSSSTGILGGLKGLIGVSTGGSGTVNGYSGLGFTNAELVSFGSSGSLYVDNNAHALGGVLVTGNVDYANLLIAAGYSGTALNVGGGGQAIFGASSTVSLTGSALVGDTLGPGTLDVLSADAGLSGNLTLAGSGSADGSSLAVLGAFSISGTIFAGLSASAVIESSGSLTASALSLGGSGQLNAYETSSLSFASLANSGTITFTDKASLSTGAYSGSGALQLGGQSVFGITGQGQFFTGSAVTIGTDATLFSANFIQSGGSLVDSGLLAASGTAILQNTSLTGGRIDAGTLNIAGTLAGDGVISAGLLQNSGVLEASGGRLLLAAGSITGQAPLEIGAGATLEISSANMETLPVNFTGGSALLVLDNPAAGFSGVTGMAAYDAVDLVGIATGLVTIQGGDEVEIFNNAGTEIASFGIQTQGSALPSLSVISDGGGGALITLGGEIPCFTRGTRLLTPDGYRPVEALRPGDPVINANGERRPVRWVGWRTLDLGPSNAREARPVLITPGAFGAGRPAKAVRLSPLHGIYAQGSLIPVKHLVNGATILRDETVPAVTYYHVELDRHDVLLAEGLECESYFCHGNRGGLLHQLGEPSPAARPFAHYVTSGARLAAVRRQLHAQALASGFVAGYIPKLRAVGEGEDVLPRITRMGRMRFAFLDFNTPVRDFTLLSASFSPADTDPDSEDRRELGLCLAHAPGLTPVEGWFARADGDAGLWMGRQAKLRSTQRRRRISLPIAALAQSWRQLPANAALAPGSSSAG